MGSAAYDVGSMVGQALTSLCCLVVKRDPGSSALGRSGSVIAAGATRQSLRAAFTQIAPVVNKDGEFIMYPPGGCANCATLLDSILATEGWNRNLAKGFRACGRAGDKSYLMF
jgi:hypothetical protein